ncbi:FAD-binding domain-containing protein [Undibacterium flavidum]|uniref:Deoxyribodipyrimidine photo-lyase n=1 Tax=Undibacterium flavidum TaxID=2762297 RepID=A0ABR6Y6G6_9BURK|nr:FAD-binding domain-containing protein [Undibacterium flavidum]MBC3872208.1 deoxyribodipyrimidine photo-lyase [Undibacterium flavidum]
MSYSVVWFKRDLRLYDHAALVAAASRGPILCLYVVEPDLWAQADAARQHFEFILESLRDLYIALKQRGGRLHVVTGDITEVLNILYDKAPFHSLCAHEETGNGWTYQRDLAVARWCQSHQVNWLEFRQFGVVRRLADRDHWKASWDAHVEQLCLPVPTQMAFVDMPWQDALPPSACRLDLAQPDPPRRQRGGRQLGLEVLSSFLYERSAYYRGGISSPLSAPGACSRLSPYLTFGCLSLREIVHATVQRMEQLHEDPLVSKHPSATRMKQGLNAFVSRLYWHCHFIQKLESEPEIEFQNMHRGYDGMCENEFNDAHFQAFTQGLTGWPMVDACIAMLRETGWINFRMRAMLVSVASYPLWLDWRPVGVWLATQFLDYEPGIHWSQMQMQAGTTGINVPRVYNPIKQAHDHDPKGVFVRRWLPAMRKVPDLFLFEPWTMPSDVQAACGIRLGLDIPVPLVDLDAATREAKAKLFAVRGLAEVKAAKSAVVKKHGSRSARSSKPGKRDSKKLKSPEVSVTAEQTLAPQLGFDF